ncbi:MAG: YbbR-like domain-containing protein [Myxococcales bacterium]|nr:YbbR-like domain-containing protein [Myxococcales bacterium]
MIRHWKRKLLNNALLKVVSISFGVILYFLVQDDQVRELDIEVPVTIENLGDLYVVTGDIPTQVRVRLKGRWSQVVRVLERRVRPYEIDTNLLRSSETFSFDPLRIGQLVGVTGISVESIDPPSFPVRIDVRVSKVVPIRLEMFGEPAEGFTVDHESVRYSPRTVEIVGAKAALEEVEEIFTHPLDLTGLTGDLRTRLGLRKPNVKFISLRDDGVSVEVVARERSIREVVKAVPVVVRNCNLRMACTVQPVNVDVTLEGGYSRVHAMKNQNRNDLVAVDAFYVSQQVGTQVVQAVFARPVEGIIATINPPTVSIIVSPIYSNTYGPSVPLDFIYPRDDNHGGGRDEPNSPDHKDDENNGIDG